MKNSKILLFIISLFITSQVLADTKTNKTFFMPRSSGTNLAMQMTSWYTFISQDQPETFGSSFQSTLFFQDSTNGSDLGKYFMFDKKNTLKIGQSADADINPSNFDLSDNYDGTISFEPEQFVWGLNVDFYQDLSKFVKGFYYSVSMPMVSVENNPGFKENITTQGTSSNTVKKVLNGENLSSDWSQRFEYAKIEGKKKENGLTDFDTKLGYKIFDEKRVKLDINVAVTVPTGNKSRGTYFWEPIVGNGRHWALGAGFNSDFILWKNDDYSKQFSLIVCTNYRYLFENRQIRTLELKNKNWGRFIRMRQQDPNDATQVLGNTIPGINVMTRKVKVESGSQLDLLANLHFKYKKWNFELGYNLWARESEDVKLNESWDAPGVYGLASSNMAYQADVRNAVFPAGAQPFDRLVYPEPIATGVSSATTIKAFAPGNGEFIEETNVDLSGHPSALSHKILGGISYDFNMKDRPWFVGIAASYEFAPDNTELEQWAIWAKIGVTI